MGCHDEKDCLTCHDDLRCDDLRCDGQPKHKDSKDMIGLRTFVECLYDVDPEMEVSNGNLVPEGQTHAKTT